MKKVFIEYNPYTLKTKFTVDGKQLAGNSKIAESIKSDSRLQEWVEKLPQALVDEFNDSNFQITFHGTVSDYEDLSEVFEQAKETNKFLSVAIDFIPAKEVAEKQKLVEQIFQDIQAGPFEELRDPALKNAFENAKSSDFPICVVATMSAGKSTLINSLLERKLMPSKQEACTAIITKLKDVDGSKKWRAKVYTKDGTLLQTCNDLTYEDMERLNSDTRVSTIEANGNIPFVSSDEISLVLVDTPGPNNSRDPEHKAVQIKFLGQSSKALVLYIMEATFGSDDDNALLQRVAESMQVGGKQSKDRFIFVVNKLDDRRGEDGSMTATLDRVRDYLKSHHIENPNLFPAAALPALNIRLLENGTKLDEDTIDETEMKVRKFNRNDNLHLEQYAVLPASLKKKIETDLFEAKSSGNKNQEALIHTGIISVEAAIRQYVDKYAKTAKIKNVVDTFISRINSLNVEANYKNQLLQNQQECAQIAAQIGIIESKVAELKGAQIFKKAVDEAVQKVKDKASHVVDTIVEKYQSKIRSKISDLRGRELSISDAKYEVRKMKDFASSLEPDFRTELEDMIQANLVYTGYSLIEAYKSKLASMINEIGIGNLKINISPLEMMSGYIPDADSYSLSNLERSRSRQVDKGHYESRRKWWNPFSWFSEDVWVPKYVTETTHYIDSGELAQTYFAPIEESLYSNGRSTKNHAVSESEEIAKLFVAEFKRLDKILENKLAELRSYATDKDKVEERIKETERNLAWLQSIKNRVDSILEI